MDSYITIPAGTEIYDICATPRLYEGESSVVMEGVWGYVDGILRTINDKEMYTYGRYRFKKPGFMLGGTEINTVPGVKITFGAPEDYWSVDNDSEFNDGLENQIDPDWYRKHEDDEIIIFPPASGNPSLVSHKLNGPVNPLYGVPTSGTFYKIEPYVNGLFYVYGRWNKKEDGVVVSEDNIDRFVVNGYNKEDGYDQWSFNLKAGHTYYLYTRNPGSESAADTRTLDVKEFTYNPSFFQKDIQIDKASISVNNKVHDYPILAVSDPDDKVNYLCEKNGSKNPDELIKNFNNQTGSFDFVENGGSGKLDIIGVVDAKEGNLKIYADYTMTINDMAADYTYEEVVGTDHRTGYYRAKTSGSINNTKHADIEIPGLRMNFAVGNSYDADVYDSEEPDSSYMDYWQALALEDVEANDGTDNSNVVTAAYRKNAYGEFSPQVVLLDDDGLIPHGGTYYRFNPNAIGFLRIEGVLPAGHYIKVVATDPETKANSLDTGDYIQEYSRTFYIDEDTYGWTKDSVLLLAGYEYFMYDAGTDPDPDNVYQVSENLPDYQYENSTPLELHAVSFSPRFVVSLQATEPTQKATAQLGGLYNSYPRIDSYTVYDCLTFESDKPEKAEIKPVRYEDKAAVWVTTPVAITDEGAPANITATVRCWDANHANYDNLWTTDSYALTVIANKNNTYAVNTRMQHYVGDTIKAVNGIVMTYGGWNERSNKNYFIDDKQHAYELDGQVGSDYYNEATTFNGIAYNQYDAVETGVWYYYETLKSGKKTEVDDYSAARMENKELFNPEDIVITEWDEEDKSKGKTVHYKEGKASRFSAPCRGTYFKFEPYRNGTLHLYLYQNGMKNIEDFDSSDKSSTGAVYIIDESGYLVKPTQVSSESVYPTITYSWWRYNLSDVELELNEQFLGCGGKNSYQEFNETYAGKPVSIFTTDDGFGTRVISSDILKYDLNLEAGKTYYVFGNGAKMDIGISGFVYDAKMLEPTIQDMTDDVMQVPYTEGSHKRPVYKRVINSGAWNPVMLPYSMNEWQVKDVFGEDAQILYFDGIEDNILKFKKHYYRTISAAKPFLVKPSKDVSELSLSEESLFNVVTIPDSLLKNRYDESEKTDFYTFKEESNGYDFVGSFASQTIRNRDYYFDKNGDIRRLINSKGSVTLGSYRAFIRRHDDIPESQAKELRTAFTSFDDEDEMITSGIKVVSDDELTTTGKKSDGVYTVDGRKVNTNTKLNKGVYIKNGQKYIVR